MGPFDENGSANLKNKLYRASPRFSGLGQVHKPGLSSPSLEPFSLESSQAVVENLAVMISCFDRSYEIIYSNGLTFRWDWTSSLCPPGVAFNEPLLVGKLRVLHKN